MRRGHYVLALLVLSALAVAACRQAGEPFNTPNPDPVCIAAAGLEARMDDLRNLDVSTATRDDVIAVVSQARGAWLTLESQVRVLAEADEQARAMRREAEEYVDSKLAQFEIALRRILEDAQASSRALAKTLDQVEAGRERLRAPGTVAAQEFGEPDDEAVGADAGARRIETQLYDEEEP